MAGGIAREIAALTGNPLRLPAIPEQTPPAGTPRAEGCAGPTTEGGFIRVDCRDWTHIVPDPDPYPAAAWPTPYADDELDRALAIVRDVLADVSSAR